MAYVLEYVVFVLFESYDYDPDFMTNEYFDNLFGSLTSQAFAFPIMAMVVAAYQLKFRYILFISTMFMGIEELFSHWDIYTHHWWKTVYTGVLMTMGFSISKDLVCMANRTVYDICALHYICSRDARHYFYYYVYAVSIFS